MNDYFKALEYLYGLEKFGIIFGLENITWLLSLLGNPHRSFRSIHVGGTNGKGSVAAMLSSVLAKGGIRTGTYTSPHLVSFTERIAINEEPIPEEEVVQLTGYIKNRIDSEDPGRIFTFFDFTTALAFEYFKRKRVDMAVVEVGLGGRLDSTNVVHPLASIITNVDFDHKNYLGDTLSEIAGEKAGIIKDGVPVVTGAGGSALETIRAAAKDRSPLFVLGESFRYEKRGEQLMAYKGSRLHLDDVRIGLRGDHQLFNASLVLCATEILAARGLAPGEESIRAGLSSVKWPGRLEITGRDPIILLDAAHNPHAIRTLTRFLETHFKGKRKVLVFGVMKDKDFRGMLDELRPVIDMTILTRPQIDRAALPQDLAPFVPGAVITDSVADALAHARAIAAPDALIVVTGSFYTIGEAKEFLEKPL
jgi:dihydrofolate synthase/folylpolyglutamate synthase